MWETRNSSLIFILILASLGCSSFETMSNSSRRGRFVKQETTKKALLVETATLIDPDGRVEELVSIDPRITNDPVRIPTIRFNRNKKLCNLNTKSEYYALKQNELDLELAFMINSLNSQVPSTTKRGNLKRTLTENMITNLYNTPDCGPFKFKLNIVKRLIKGYQLEGISEKVVRR